MTPTTAPDAHHCRPEHTHHEFAPYAQGSPYCGRLLACAHGVYQMTCSKSEASKVHTERSD